jgi:hypothetical protein
VRNARRHRRAQMDDVARGRLADEPIRGTWARRRSPTCAMPSVADLRVGDTCRAASVAGSGSPSRGSPVTGNDSASLGRLRWTDVMGSCVTLPDSCGLTPGHHCCPRCGRRCNVVRSHPPMSLASASR